MKGASKRMSLFAMRTRTIVSGEAKSLVKIILTEEPSVRSHRRQWVATNILGSWGGNYYCLIIDQILDFILWGPIIFGIMSLGIHVIGATGVLIIILPRRAGHGLLWTLAMRLVFQSFWYNCAMVRAKG